MYGQAPVQTKRSNKIDQQAANQLQLQIHALASHTQALTTAQQSHMQVNAQLQQKNVFEQRLHGVTTLLRASVKGAGQSQHPQQSAGSSAAGRPVSHIDALKPVKQPQSLKDRDQWVETYLALLSDEFPDELDMARKGTTFVDPVDMTDVRRSGGRQLFAMLNSRTQALTVATRTARGTREQNGWEFWRCFGANSPQTTALRVWLGDAPYSAPNFPPKRQTSQLRCRNGKSTSTSMRPNMAKPKPSATRIPSCHFLGQVCDFNFLPLQPFPLLSCLTLTSFITTATSFSFCFRDHWSLLVLRLHALASSAEKHAIFARDVYHRALQL